MTHPLLQAALSGGTPVVDDNRATFLWQRRATALSRRRLQRLGPGRRPLRGRRSSPASGRSPSISRPMPTSSMPSCSSHATTPALPDPLNDRTAPNGMGHVNHYFYMPEGRADVARMNRGAGVPQGKLSRHRIENSWLLADGKRWVHLYQPPVDQPVPLLVVYDAQDYLTRGRITQIVDNLIAEGRDRADRGRAASTTARRARGIEYSCNEATIGSVVTRGTAARPPASEPGRSTRASRLLRRARRVDGRPDGDVHRPAHRPRSSAAC